MNVKELQKKGRRILECADKVSCAMWMYHFEDDEVIDPKDLLPLCHITEYGVNGYFVNLDFSNEWYEYVRDNKVTGRQFCDHFGFKSSEYFHDDVLDSLIELNRLCIEELFGVVESLSRTEKYRNFMIKVYGSYLQYDEEGYPTLDNGAAYTEYCRDSIESPELLNIMLGLE